MKVSVDELKALPQNRLTVSFKEELAGLHTVKPVLGDLTLIWSGSSVKMSGTVKTLLKLSCDRCLRPYFQSLTVDIEERFVPQSLIGMGMGEREPHKELLKNDFYEPVPDDGILDITDVVYQAVTLATPTFCRCGDECPGMPSRQSNDKSDLAPGSPQSGVEGWQPGSEQNSGRKSAQEAGGSPVKTTSSDLSQSGQPIDPRWKNLKTLFPKENSDQNS